MTNPKTTCCEMCSGQYRKDGFFIGIKCFDASCDCHQPESKEEWEQRFRELSCNLNGTEVQIKFIQQQLAAAEKIGYEKGVKEVLTKILEQGHGGGNWRRLIIQHLPSNSKS